MVVLGALPRDGEGNERGARRHLRQPSFNLFMGNPWKGYRRGRGAGAFKQVTRGNSPDCEERSWLSDIPHAAPSSRSFTISAVLPFPAPVMTAPTRSVAWRSGSSNRCEYRAVVLGCQQQAYEDGGEDAFHAAIPHPAVGWRQWRRGVWLREAIAGLRQ